MTLEALAARLTKTAEQRAAMHGVVLGDGADHDVRQFALKGAQRIMLQPAREAREADVRRATEGFERLIDEMVVARRQIVGYSDRNADVIGEETLARALAELCPLFPIC